MRKRDAGIFCNIHINRVQPDLSDLSGCDDTEIMELVSNKYVEDEEARAPRTKHSARREEITEAIYQAGFGYYILVDNDFSAVVQ